MGIYLSSVFSFLRSSRIFSLRLFVAFNLFLILTMGESTHLLAQDEYVAGSQATTLRVAIDDRYPPYVFHDANGVLIGYLVDVWKLWERKTGVHVELMASDWAKAQEDMASGRADVIDTMFSTPERLKTMDFSLSYVDIPVSIYTLAGIGGIIDIKTLQGFLVGVKKGDACATQLQQSGITTLVGYPNYEALIHAAESGKVKVFCLAEPPANFLLSRDGAEGSFNKAFQLYTGQFRRGVHKGDVKTFALLERGFTDISPQENKVLHDKWMGTPMERSPYYRYLGYSILAAILFACFLMLWGVMLRRLVRQRTEQLRISENFFHTLAKINPVGIFRIDINQNCIFVNLSWCEISGQSFVQARGDGWMQGIYSEDREKVRLAWQSAIAESRPFSLEFRFQHQNGKLAWVYGQSVAMSNDAGVVTGYLGTVTDITHQKVSEDEIRYLAQYDFLTGLPNRRFLHDHLQKALLSAVSNQRSGAVLFIDLDNFKTLNDTLGHDKGDFLLQQTAQILSDCVRDIDMVARHGGDEFVVVLEELSSDEQEAFLQTERIAEKILADLNHTYILGSQQHHSTASVGISLFGHHHVKVEELLKQTDLAMYQSKVAGRNTLRFFNPEMQDAVTDRATMETDIRKGIQDNQFLLYYQPQMDDRGGVIGAECLLRWAHPERGLVSPSAFIPLAEDTGLILPLGYWVLETACEQLAIWGANTETAHLVLAVNVSSRQFRQTNFVQQIQELLHKTGANPHKLKLELTESLLLDNVESVIATMMTLKAQGVCFSLDDFGTGYSSLSYLKRLPLDQLKIDQSFVRDVLTDPDDAAIAKTIISLGQSLDLSVIAEGVETEAQRQFLERYGCRAYQGYLFSRPIPLDDFTEFLDKTAELFSSEADFS